MLKLGLQIERERAFDFESRGMNESGASIVQSALFSHTGLYWLIWREFCEQIGALAKEFALSFLRSRCEACSSISSGSGVFFFGLGDRL